MALDINLLFRTLVEQKASDLHITVGSPPALRINGQIVRTKAPPVTAEDTRKLAETILNEDQQRIFKLNRELDFALAIKDVARVRANLFIQRGAVAGVFRRIPSEMPSLEQLNLVPQIHRLLDKPHGLILLTGATGSGKSTTLAAFIDRINSTTRNHIITIEDPIEYTHRHKLSIVNQREIGTDCDEFSTALRQVLREDPDVILVGEMRDKETTESALKAAETGHLVFSTLHTNGALNSINRIIQLFSQDNQEYIRTMLSFTLEAVITQALCERADKTGRVMAYEFLSITPAIRNLIRENKIHQIYGQMQIGQEGHGMVTMNQSLYQYVASGTITLAEAVAHSPEPDELLRMCEKGSRRSA